MRPIPIDFEPANITAIVPLKRFKRVIKFGMCFFIGLGFSKKLFKKIRHITEQSTI